MKKLMLLIVVVSVMLIAFAGTVLAVAPTPQAPTPGQGFGMGRGNVAPGSELATPGTGYGARGGMMGRMGNVLWAGQPDEVEALLGMTDVQIRTERLAGKSLTQIAATKAISKDKLVSTILAAKKSLLDKAVVDTKLTQAQADAIYANMQQQVPVMVDRAATGSGAGQGGCATAAGLAGQMGGRMGGRWNR